MSRQTALQQQQKRQQQPASHLSHFADTAADAHFMDRDEDETSDEESLSRSTEEKIQGGEEMLGGLHLHRHAGSSDGFHNIYHNNTSTQQGGHLSPHYAFTPHTGEIEYDVAFPDDIPGDIIHRRHSLTAELYDGNDGFRYEPSSRVGTKTSTTLPSSSKAATPEGSRTTPAYKQNSTVSLNDSSHLDTIISEQHHRSLFLSSPFAIVRERATLKTVVAQNGFEIKILPSTKEQQVLFQLQKSREISAEIMELCGKVGTFDRLVGLLLIRDSMEPYGVDINYQNPSNGGTALMNACTTGLLDIVQLLYESSYNWIISYSLDVDIQDFNGINALMRASQNGHLILVKYLCEVLNVNITLTDMDGWNALMYAAAKGHWHVVEYLVYKGAYVLAATVHGDTVLMLAANNGYLNIVRFLVENTIVGDKFDAASGAAKQERLTTVTEEMKQKDEMIKQQSVSNVSGTTAILPPLPHQSSLTELDSPSSRSSSPPLPDELEVEAEEAQNEVNNHQQANQSGQGLEQRNMKGWTALLGAAHYGQVYVVHYLVSRGCDPSLIDRHGCDAYNMPLSLLALSRTSPGAASGSAAIGSTSIPVTQPQVIAAIHAGMRDRDKAHNVKREAIERAVVRFKRAERFWIDAEAARARHQNEMAHLLYTYAYGETRPHLLLKEEITIREQSKATQSNLGLQVAEDARAREKKIRETLRTEAQRNFFLAERYVAAKAYGDAEQCLEISLKYEPSNPEYLAKQAQVKTLKTGTPAAPPPQPKSPMTGEEHEPGEDDEEQQEGKPNPDPKPPRSCSLFGFSFF